MASSHTFVHSRNNNNQHVPQKINMTALHGATSAFSTSPANTPQDVRTRTRNMGTAVFPDSNLRPKSEASVPSDTDSNPPEIGSVRDKIGRFAATSSTPSLQGIDQDQDDAKSVSSSTGFDRRDVKLPVRSQTPQHVAARLATARNPVRDESAPFVTQHKTSRPSSPLTSDNSWIKGRDMEMAAPRPIRGGAGPSPALQKLIQDELRETQPLPQPPSIPRKPVSQSSTPPSSQSQSPSIAQLAALRSSPSPSPSLNSTASRGRPPPPRPNKSRTFPIAPAASESNLVTSSRQISPPSTDEKEKKPALPPRPRPTAPSPPPRAPVKSFTHDGALPEAPGAHKPRMTPSMASLSTMSHSNNSTSTLNRSANGMDEESLSNAIVASSLASARAPSPKPVKIPPTPPRRRRSRSRSLLSLGLSHSNGSEGRLPSPTKSGGLRQTLRDLPKSELVQNHRDHHHHHHHNHPKFPIQRHPHKHHEGDRKRYRAYMTEPERKRYEGVWAANKGLHIPVPPPLPSKIHPSCPAASYYKAAVQKYPSNAADMVLNLVVRDIWSRSNLPPNALEHVWNLVDGSGDGLLRKGEFVVGMWLIDQQLKGHKLPATVPDTVWDSAGRLPVVKPPSQLT